MDYDFLDELIKEQEENINNYEKYNTNCLLIFDDMITDLNNNDESKSYISSIRIIFLRLFLWG